MPIIISPTEAMLRRSVDLAGGGGGTGITGFGVASIGLAGASGVSSGAGLVAHATNCSIATAAASRGMLMKVLGPVNT